MSRWHGALTRDLLEIDPMEISLNAGGTWQPAAHLALQVGDLRFQIWEAHVELREDARAERLRHRVQRRFKVGEGGETCGVASREQITLGGEMLADEHQRGNLLLWKAQQRGAA
eukprot:955267-Prymnesium_polylepis.2